VKRFVSLQNVFILLSVLALSCNTYYAPVSVSYQYSNINNSLPKDSSLILLTKPYRDSVTKAMADIVGYTDKAMQLQQPSGSINNFFADAILYAAEKKFNKKVDAAVLNYGGIRLTNLQKGPVTKGDIFELMPFENMLVLVDVNGETLQQLLNISAAQDGWPIANIRLQVKDKKAINVLINGEPLSPNKIYTIATSDYVATGGENAAMLKSLKKIDASYLIRDAVFDYIKFKNNRISASEEKRVTHAN
jgi:2',3'-cyclic-nucleotide 2'-phosphodiesterase (5'-nucleotidase family)